MKLERERRLSLSLYLWDTVTLYATVVLVTQRGKPRLLLKGVGTEDGTWISDHMWVECKESDRIVTGNKVKVTGKVMKYLPLGEIEESYGLENETIEVI